MCRRRNYNSASNKTASVSPISSPKSHSRKMKESLPRKTKADLWNGCLERKIGDGAIVQMDGIGSASHTVYARMLPCPVKNDGGKSVQKLTIGTVVDVLVGEGWKQVAKDILEKHKHIEKDTFPSAKQLLKLGAVWLLNETEYTNGGSAHAHRCKEEEEDTIPKWEDFSLRVHYAPERFFSAYEVDWGKYCRGLLIGGSVEAAIGGEVPHVPLQGLPDLKDGVIVYENPDIGYAIINKQGSLPLYATTENHLEDVVTMFSNAQTDRRTNDPHHPHQHCKKYVSIPSRSGIDTETSGLVIVATKKEFCSHITKLLDTERKQNNSRPADEIITPAAADAAAKSAVMKKFKCLVCIKKADSLDELEKFQETGKVITHYCCPQSAAPKIFLRHKPNNSKGRTYVKCQMRITQVGASGRNCYNGREQPHFLRAACVSSRYGDSIDSNLAHALWGSSKKTETHSDHPAEDIHTKYVMELEVEVIGNYCAHQLRGQLAALGCPIVGDTKYGGGVCEYRSHMHGWNRMALQCCELSFLEPKWKVDEDNNIVTSSSSSDEECSKTNKDKNATKKGGNKVKEQLISSDRLCHFRLNKAWWSEYMEKYEMYYHNNTEVEQEAEQEVEQEVQQ